MRFGYTEQELQSVQHPWQADVFIKDCLRQDHELFGGQYVWTVQTRFWNGPRGYYPRLGDQQWDLTFDIPADWACDGWRFIGSDSNAANLNQGTTALDMNQHPNESARHLITKAIEYGILDNPVGLTLFDAVRRKEDPPVVVDKPIESSGSVDEDQPDLSDLRDRLELAISEINRLKRHVNIGKGIE